MFRGKNIQERVTAMYFDAGSHVSSVKENRSNAVVKGKPPTACDSRFSTLTHDSCMIYYVYGVALLMTQSFLLAKNVTKINEFSALVGYRRVMTRFRSLENT